MYSKCHQFIRKHSPKLSQHAYRLTSSTSNATFKYSANIQSKDCVRLTFIYGLCGTFASFLSMSFEGKVLVLSFTEPTPQRFVFCTSCWALGGMASWMLLWTKPDALIRAASSRVRYGLFHGTQTTLLSMMSSFGLIAFWSVYFDILEWQNRYGEWKQSLMTDIGNDNGEMDQNSEHQNNPQMNESVENKMTQVLENQPTWTYHDMGRNMYEPCKVFLMTNAPIWLLCGSVTGMIAARVLTSSVLINPVNVTTAIAALSVSNTQEQSSGLELLDENINE